MAHSKIIKELANGTVSLEIALKRTKVLLLDLHDDKLSSWINNEIVGYSSVDEIPDYRKIEGSLTGSYLQGTVGAHTKVTNASIPTIKMPEDIRKELLSLKFTNGIAGLETLIETYKTKGTISSLIPADFFPLIVNYSGLQFTRIIEAKVTISVHEVRSILSVIENKLLDVLIKLENEFGVLDDLDISVNAKDDNTKKEIIRDLYLIVFNDDKNISIGDNNVIKNSNIVGEIND